ncbi:MAG: hypothetical protein FJZ49_07105 [Candidatus Verstraetearchaeota archaeon]|nr:hypothetical protein [Candidatus Verstraetearchaeota archaeon]
MAKIIRAREIERDDELGIIKKEISLPNNIVFETPSASLKEVGRMEFYSGINEITRRIDERLINFLEERGTTDFISFIRSKFLKDRLNLTIFDLRFDSVPDQNKLKTLTHCLYASNDVAIMLPIVKSKLLKENNTLSDAKFQEYLKMMAFIIDETEQIGNSKAFIGTVPLIAPKFSRSIIKLYHSRGIKSFAIDAGLRDILLNEVDFRLILSEIHDTTPLNETLIYACNLGFPQYEKVEIRADDFLSLFTYVDILGVSFKTRGGDSMIGRLPRAKIFSRERYSYGVTTYSEASKLLGEYVNYNLLRERNRLEQLKETDKIRSIIGKEKMKKYLQRKPAVDPPSLKRLESMAKLQKRLW